MHAYAPSMRTRPSSWKVGGNRRHSRPQKVLPLYERKYKFDMKGMEQDILSMKEPVFAVRPRVVFGLWKKEFVEKATPGRSKSKKAESLTGSPSSRIYQNLR